MIQVQDEIIIYKKDGTPVDVTDYVTSFSMNKGSLEGLGDGYTSTPIATASCTLKNTNEMQFSPFQKKGMIVYEKYNFTGTGERIYDNPISYLKDVRCTNSLITCSYSEGKLIFSEPISGTIELFIARVDISTYNPLNFLETEEELTFYEAKEQTFFEEKDSLFYFSKYKTVYEYEPFIGAGSQITWKRNVFDQIFYLRNVYGNGTNKAKFYITNKELVENIEIVKSVENIGFTFYEEKDSSFYDSKEKLFYESKLLKNEISININIVSFEIVGDYIEITFDSVLDEKAVVKLSVEQRINQKDYFYLDGVIGEIIEAETDVNQVTFSIKDKSYFLQDKIVSADTFRNYHSFSDDENIIHILEEEQNGGRVVKGTSESTITGIDTNFSKYSTGQTVYLYKGQDYLESTVKSITSDEIMTINEEIDTGTYDVYAEVQNSLENHIAKCLEDVADSNIGTFTLVAEDESTWRVIPKLGDQQYASVWDYIQSVTLGRAMFLGFKYQESLQQHVLTLKEIPETFEVIPKYVITDNDIINSSSYSSTSERIRTAWKLTYYDSESKQYEEYIDDDFTKGSTVAISSNKKKIITSETLSIGEYVRINDEYRIIKQILLANEYIVNVPFSESGSFDIYIQGPYTNKYGLIPALIEIDNTSSINTLEEAQRFLAKIKPQYRSVYETYTIAVRFNKFCELDNFDTIEIDSAVLSLFNEKMFVNNLQITKQGGNWIAVFECSKQADIGEQKYTRIITEKGLNKISKDDNLNTQNTFEAPTNLKASNIIIDIENGYDVYTNVTWNNYIDKAVNWELEYKKSNETWNDSISKTPTSNQEKINLTEQYIYNIRVRGVSKTGRKGEWSYVDVDARKTLVENPIQNRTWYVRLLFENDITEYFTEFDKIGYTQSELDSAIDTIEVVPNVSTTYKDINWKTRYTGTTNEIGLEKEILDRTSTKKNLNIRAIENGKYSLIGDYDENVGSATFSVLKLESFRDVTGIGNGVTFRAINNIQQIGYFNTVSNELQKISNLKLEINSNDFDSYLNNNFSTNGISGEGLSVNYEDVKLTIENIVIEFINKDSLSIGIYYANKIKNCRVVGAQLGIAQSRGLENNAVENCSQAGYFGCNLMKNNTDKNSVVKYSGCYASLSDDPTYAIATTGSDTANGGFNT